MDLNERELVERCRSGDERAFQELVDRYKDLVFALVARTVQDRARAEDLAQDVFLRVHRGLPYFRGEARLSTWIYRIVANVCAQDQGRTSPISIEDDQVRAQVATSTATRDRQFRDLELRDQLEIMRGDEQPVVRRQPRNGLLELIPQLQIAELPIPRRRGRRNLRPHLIVLDRDR